MSKEVKISKSLEDTLKNSDLLNVNTELAEVALDSFLDEGVLKDIPILGTIIGIGKAAASIRDKLFLKKLIYFLNEVSSVDADKRNTEIGKIQTDIKYQSEVGERLLFILDKCDDHEKSAIIAKFFVAFLKQEIIYDEYLHASAIINQIYIKDLYDFVRNNWSGHKIEKAGHLLNTGMVFLQSPQTYSKSYTQHMRGEDVIHGVNLFVHVTPIGSLIRNVLRDLPQIK